MKSLLSLFLLVLLGAPLLFAQDPDQYTYTFALGAIGPLDSAEGSTTPVVLARYAPPEDPSLWLQFKTSRLTARYRPQGGNWVLLGGGEAVSTGDSGALYYQGRRQREAQFWAHSPYLGLGYRLWGDADQVLRLQVKRTAYLSSPERNRTRAGFDLPEDYQEIALGVFGQFERGPWQGEVWMEHLQREALSAWALEPDPQAQGTKGWAKMVFEAPWGAQQKSQWSLEGGSGENLGFFQGFQLGGLASSVVIPGYYRSEFRAREFVRLGWGHELNFEGGAKLFGEVAAARFKAQEWFGAVEFDAPAGAMVGLMYPIESLEGLPVFLIYGQGFKAPEHSPESSRREMALMVAAAF